VSGWKQLPDEARIESEKCVRGALVPDGDVESADALVRAFEEWLNFFAPAEDGFLEGLELRSAVGVGCADNALQKGRDARVFGQ